MSLKYIGIVVVKDEADKQLDNDLREVAGKKFGMRKGSIRLACREALKEYIEKYKVSENGSKTVTEDTNATQ